MRATQRMRVERARHHEPSQALHQRDEMKGAKRSDGETIASICNEADRPLPRTVASVAPAG